MSQSFFSIGRGLDLDKYIQIIQGTGVPGGGDADVVSAGSIYCDRTNYKVYKKHTPGSGSNKWVELVDKNYVDTLFTDGSWREPVLVKDSTVYANLAAAVTAANVADTIDGETIVAGDRILFTAITGSNKNVYIVGGSTGAWTLTEDTNAATSGDAIYVRTGTDAGNRYGYDGSVWNQFGSDNATDISNLQSFVGAAGGDTFPTYTSVDQVTQNASLETAVSELDAAIGPNVVTGTYILAANNVNDNIELLDAGIAANDGDITDIRSFIGAADGDTSPTYTSTNQVTQSATLEAAVSQLDTAIGGDVTTGTYISSSNDVNTNIQAIDDALGEIRTEFTTTGITTQQVVGSVLTNVAQAAKWMLYIRANATPVNIRAVEIFSIHNRTSSADATNVDYTTYAVQQLGSAISGLAITVDVNGTGASQVMRVLVTASVTVNVKLVVETIDVDF